MDMWLKIFIGMSILWFILWFIDDKFERLERRIASLERKDSNDIDFDDE